MPNSLATELEQATAYHRAGEFQEAERHYLAILQDYPQHPEANHNLGTLLVSQQRAGEALPCFLAALEADYASGQYRKSYIDALHQAGQLDDARQVLALAMQQGLQGDQVEELAARLSAEASDQGGGERPCNREIDAVVALFSSGRLTDAASAAQALTERYPRHEFGWKALGAIYKQTGNPGAALSPMQKAAVLSPADVEAHYNLGVTLQELGRLAEAEASYRHALQIDPDYADAHSNLGVTQQGLGKLPDAEASYRRAILLRPDYVSAHSNLGCVLKEQGRFLDAEGCYRLALQISPDSAQAHNDLGDTLNELGRFSDAQACYLQALQINPDYPEAHYNLANVLLAQELTADAKAHYQRALQIRPDYPEAHYNLGSLLKNAGLPDEACASYRQALLFKPDFAEASYNLANIEKARERLDAACVCYRQALVHRPDFAEAHYNLAGVLVALGHLEEATTCFRRTVQIKPDYLDAHFNLANTLLQMGVLNDAEFSYRHALRIDPDLAATHCNLGLVLQELGRLDEAEASYRHALRLNPDYAEVHNNLGGTLQKRGQLDDAAACFRAALKVKPDFEVAHSNLIFTLDLMAGTDPAALLDERRRWNEVHASHLHQQRIHDNVPVPERRLRVGYVSGDMRTHSAAYAFGAMLTGFDADSFDVYAYSNSAMEDTLTLHFQQSVTVWRKIFGLSDNAVADLVREDKIDILVDLSGHTAGNRLLVFARKPAPIQITAWGYAAGTGMSAMDVLFSDTVFVPPDTKHFYTEKVRYLPSAIGSFFHKPCPAVNALPSLTAKGITFASFNRLAKNSAEVYRVWAEILQAIPDSRMFIKTPALDDAGTRERVRAHFTRVGIDPARIVLLGTTDRCEHMAAFNLVDIALDPFPQGGGVSALEGLMMGVPMITLRWPTLAGRVSASILTTLGLTDWIAETPERYVELAIEKANELQALAQLRQDLRGRFTASVIGDRAAYVRAAEQEYRQLWIEWCSSRQGDPG
jgi:predicted O-linked N-acetylglucosamine transferase (SPINDLY family)